MNRFPFVLKELRKQNNITQKQLAHQLGVATSRISMYEVGEREPDFEMLEKIADYFNVGINTLLGIYGEGKGSDLTPEQMIFEPNVRLLLNELGQCNFSTEDFEDIISYIQLVNARKQRSNR